MAAEATVGWVTVRVRFAPSPTGYLHVGGARTALFNWLYARHTGGTFVLRIEDTDPSRSRDDLADGIGRALHWLGLDWDEGPVRQSQRLDLYREAVAQLLADGRAYVCDCSPDEVAARAEGRDNPGYDGHCRDRQVAPGPGRPVRFRSPDEGETVVSDLVRGDVHFAHDTIEDFVLVRSDGSPGFYLPNAVDDRDLRITHVIRGEDLLPSTPRVILVRRALGDETTPVYAHVPMIVDAQRRRLSKRAHAVAVEEYRDQGYLPEALRNYLALLGWSPSGDRELLPIEEMVAEFDPSDVKPSPAFFDLQKLQAVNAHYLRALSTATFVQESLPWLESGSPWPPESFDLPAFARLAPFVQERVRTLGEVPALVDFVFLDQPEIDPASWKEIVQRQPLAGVLLAEAEAGYADCEWTAPTLHAVTLSMAKRLGLKLAAAQAPVRVAVTGRSVGPPLFESLEVVGRDRVIERLRAARERLEEP